MTNEQFLTTFQHHLNVGGQQREEIIAEVKSHLEEEGPEKIGDPKLLAQKSNRVHLGFFSSFAKLLWLRLITFLIFEFIYFIFYLLTKSQSLFYWLDRGTYIFEFLPSVIFLFGCLMLRHMHRRWIYTIVWAATFAAGICILGAIGSVNGYYGTGIAKIDIHLFDFGQLFSLWLTFAVIALAIVVATEGKNIIWPRHTIAGTIAAFMIMFFASYFALPIIANTATNYHYTESTASFSMWIFEHQHYLAFFLALLGGTMEYIRHQGIQRHSLK
jgi:hypothetical protein